MHFGLLYRNDGYGKALFDLYGSLKQGVPIIYIRICSNWTRNHMSGKLSTHSMLY